MDVPADKVLLHIRVIVVFMKNFDGLLAERKVERVGMFSAFPTRHFVREGELHLLNTGLALRHCREFHLDQKFVKAF